MSDLSSIKLLTVPEAADILRVSQQKVYKLVYEGELDALHVGRCVRIVWSSLTGYIRRNINGGMPEV